MTETVLLVTEPFILLANLRYNYQKRSQSVININRLIRNSLRKKGECEDESYT